MKYSLMGLGLILIGVGMGVLTVARPVQGLNAWRNPHHIHLHYKV